jgi:hypothetical protein
VAQLVLVERRAAVRRPRVRISARHPNGGPPPEQTAMRTLELILSVSSTEDSPTTEKKGNLLTGEEGKRGWARRAAESYDRKKAWSSINHSVLSGAGICKRCLSESRHIQNV